MSGELVEKVAGLLLQFEEFGTDAAAHARNEGWGARLVASGNGEEHSGDCTNQCWPCLVCLREDALKRAEMFLAALYPPAVVEGPKPIIAQPDKPD